MAINPASFVTGRAGVPIPAVNNNSFPVLALSALAGLTKGYTDKKNLENERRDKIAMALLGAGGEPSAQWLAANGGGSYNPLQKALYSALPNAVATGQASLKFDASGNPVGITGGDTYGGYTNKQLEAIKTLAETEKIRKEMFGDPEELRKAILAQQAGLTNLAYKGGPFELKSDKPGTFEEMIEASRSMSMVGGASEATKPDYDKAMKALGLEGVSSSDILLTWKKQWSGMSQEAKNKARNNPKLLAVLKQVGLTVADLEK